MRKIFFFVMCNFLTFYLVASSTANALEIYWHHEDGASYEAPDGTIIRYSYVVIDGYQSDVSSLPDGRFQNGGVRGGGGASLIKDNKIYGLYNGEELSCSIAPNQARQKGLPPGTMYRTVYIDPNLPKQIQQAFRDQIASINFDQGQRGRSFMMMEVGDVGSADIPVMSDPYEIETTKSLANAGNRTNRSGYVLGSIILVKAAASLLNSLAVHNMAAHELGHTFGLNHTDADPDYPSTMDPESDNGKNPGFDPCTLAAIDKNINHTGQ